MKTSKDQALRVLLSEGWTYWYPERNHYFLSDHDKSFVRDPLSPSCGHQIMAAYEIHLEREALKQRPTLF
jgi:hypothetical protein